MNTAPSTPAALRIEGLRAGYGETVVLENLDLAVAAGEAVSIIGRNGVGKSTLVASVMGRTRRHAGTITFEGRPLDGLKAWQRCRAGIGFVPQEREIFASLTVHENLAIAQRGGQWNAARVYELFPRLQARRGNLGNQLSGGEQQMLAIGRALMGNPRLLLMDEPSEGLAPVIVEQVQAAMTRLRDEFHMSILLVEQNSRLALGFAPRCIVMNRGRIIRDGPSVDLQADPALLERLIGIDAEQVGG
ncbi:MAG: ABC transporter ATP-binding protein [Burkholderiaceae bacterium]